MDGLKTLQIGVVTLGVAVMVTVAPALADEKSPNVVELYTSQGCSSCPPADRYLGKLAQRDDLIALSFHVDYWDYIGWKDTFALPESTARQRQHGKSLNSRYVYTPELVIDGVVDVVGSEERKVDQAIAEVQLSSRNTLSVSLTASGRDRAIIQIAAQSGMPDADVWLIEFDQERTVDVRRGENSGHALTYYNVVRNIRKVGRWSGDATKISVDLAAIREVGRDGCVVIVQRERGGPVFGAARLQFAATN